MLSETREFLFRSSFTVLCNTVKCYYTKIPYPDAQFNTDRMVLSCLGLNSNKSTEKTNLNSFKCPINSNYKIKLVPTPNINLFSLFKICSLKSQGVKIDE